MAAATAKRARVALHKRRGAHGAQLKQGSLSCAVVEAAMRAWAVGAVAVCSVALSQLLQAELLSHPQ